MQKVSFAQAGIAIKEKRIIRIAGRLTDRNTTCMSKAIARAHYKVIKGIIRVKSKPGPGTFRGGKRLPAAANAEIYTNKTTGYLLSSMGETAFAIVTQKLDGGIVGTTDSE